MQGLQQRSRLDRAGLVSEVLIGKITKMKLAIARTLPQEFRFDLRDQRLATGQQFARRRFLVAQQHIGRLDLGTLAGGGFDLQRRVVVGQDSGGFEGAVFFEQNIHRRDYNRQNSKSCGNKSGKRVKLWSPPANTSWRLPA